MSTVPKLNQWTAFVRAIGGYVGLDLMWNEGAWAEFPHDAEGPINVMCRLGEDGDLDLTSRPSLDGDNIRKHPRLPEALAALAYVNPAPRGDGEPVSRDRHRGDWHQIKDDLAVAVAGSSGVGGVDVGEGRGAFLVRKGKLWLPHGPQEIDDRRAPPKPDAPDAEAAIEPSRGRGGPVPVQKDADRSAEPGSASANGRGADDVVRELHRAPKKREKERRSRIFGEEADDLINQARAAGRRRA